MPTRLRFSMFEHALSISTDIPVLALEHVHIILQTGNDCQTLSCLMTAYMYTKSTISIDQNQTAPIGIICQYNQIMTHSLLFDILAVMMQSKLYNLSKERLRS